jgi:hypothetical protein
MNDFVTVPIPLTIYRQLLARYPDRAHAVIEDVVTDFLERTADDLPNNRRGRGAGVYWDTLFLPDKTRLRTKYYGEYKYAEVKADKLIYDGKTCSSVAQATNKMRGNTSNNAWRVVEVLRPNDSQWIPADVLRKRGGL